jgi:hypothetical protein
MKKHTWIVEFRDGGAAGGGEFWICSTCGASGGPCALTSNGYKEKIGSWIFYADGTGLQLSEDCEISEIKISNHLNMSVDEYRASLLLKS